MKALILAAGLGTRLLPYTRHTPKPLFTINRRPVLALTIERLQRAGCRAVIVNTHHLHERIEAFLSETTWSLPVTARYEPEILGTGGAVRNTADLWADGPLLVINADVVSDIDLAQVYRYHRQAECSVTMVMHDWPEFNTVTVDADDRVVDFAAGEPQAGQHRMAFTGIHVLNRRVLDYLPPQGPAHIIDAYAAMIKTGKPIAAMVLDHPYWRDIGTPQSYFLAAAEQMAPLAFEKALGRRPSAPIERFPLQGDGSDRRWYRVACGTHSLVMVDHGIRPARDGQQEVDAFIDIGNHLAAKGVAVPRIWLHDRFSGLVFLEDLGQTHLQDIAARQNNPELLQIYRKVIDQWLHMALSGKQDFSTRWTWQTPCYDRELILERECRYFVDAFLVGYLGRSETYADLVADFSPLADRTIDHGIPGFLHRDLQSRNIMVKEERIYFIDFQGGRLGPLQYDLASLLIDPYVQLPPEMQKELLAYALHRLKAIANIDADGFQRGYDCCALTRNLQMLGAFGYLTRVKEKGYFEAYIPAAVSTLQRHLNSQTTLRLPRLTAIINEIADEER
ncbi:sugar phosphate nucleotidyltransferase [Desulfatitalea tepidiphila]|uniref:sugar phosphate nucleotidyltransferase n=1 Tax=Desulfatitalea tepidiphila TaxID=1185843 RepID=UPI0006B4CF65|nr:sugar phosphate nucleotidyltransferase [Desulfatitalea tepidiphila]